MANPAPPYRSQYAAFSADLSAGETLLAYVLADHSDADGWCALSQLALGTLASLGERTVRSRLAGLQRRGLLGIGTWPLDRRQHRYRLTQRRAAA